MSDADGPPPGRPEKRGADLARDALAEARARNAAKRAASGKSGILARRGGSGARRRWSGPGPDARDPKPFGAIAKQWVKQTATRDEVASATILSSWPQIVGPDLASHCRPVSLVDGVLNVQAESTAWATQIRMLAPTLLGKIATAVGNNVVKQVRAQGPTSPSWRFGPRHVSGRGPRDTYG